MGFSLQWLLSLGTTGSRVLGLQQLQHAGSVVEHGLSRMWDLSGPGKKPVSPAWAEEFLATGPQGSPSLTS